MIVLVAVDLYCTGLINPALLIWSLCDTTRLVFYFFFAKPGIHILNWFILAICFICVFVLISSISFVFAHIRLHVYVLFTKLAISIASRYVVCVLFNLFRLLVWSELRVIISLT